MPILLGLFAVTADVPDATYLYNIVFVVVLASVVLQGSTISSVASLCRVRMRPVAPDVYHEDR